MNSEIADRLENLRHALKLNWGQLAEQIGVTTQMLGLVRRGQSSFGRNTLRRVEELEASASIAHCSNSLAPDHAAATCPRCEELRQEITRLHNVVDRMQSNLDLVNNNLAQTLELLHLKNDNATRVSTASSGSGRSPPNKKGA